MIYTIEWATFVTASVHYSMEKWYQIVLMEFVYFILLRVDQKPLLGGGWFVDDFKEP